MSDRIFNDPQPNLRNPVVENDGRVAASTDNLAPISLNKIRQINIEEVNRGYIVRVGCHTFAISTKQELITKLTEYISEPDKTEDKWFKGELF